VVDRNEWRQFFDQLSKDREGDLVTIELLDSSHSDRREAELLPFFSATYDRKDDVIVVSVGGRSPRYPVVLRHIISHPSEVSTMDDGSRTTAVRVLDRDGTVTLITFSPATSDS
jgi:hypothetical protein